MSPTDFSYETLLVEFHETVESPEKNERLDSNLLRPKALLDERSKLPFATALAQNDILKEMGQDKCRNTTKYFNNRKQLSKQDLNIDKKRYWLNYIIYALYTP